MKRDQLEEVKIEDFALSQVGFHPIVRVYMQRLGLVELINQLVLTEMDVEPGIIVAGMIQDTLSGRSPLYHLEDFVRTQDSELIFGKKVAAEDFRDHNVGRVLDRIYEVELAEFSVNFPIGQQLYSIWTPRLVIGTVPL